MLLLMTLVVLASSTCRSQDLPEIHGKRVGDYFYITNEDKEELKGIRVSTSILNEITGIQLRFGNKELSFYGNWSLHNEEILLEDGEHVIQVDGSTGDCLATLTFITDKGRSVSCGLKKGKDVFSDNGGKNKYLETVYGVNSPGHCIKGIGFIWKPVTEPMESS